LKVSSLLSSDRAKAALLGVALGDALGMPSQTLSRTDIVARYGRITDFVPPFEGHPVSHGLGAAMVTDDTEQALLLARRIIASPEGIDDAGWAQDLLDWEADVKARGLLDLLGPSSKAALEALLDGVPVTETGRKGTTNGAAMRIVPVGIATPGSPVSMLVDQVEMTCRVTHNTGEAIAAASAVAAVVSAGISGLDFEAALESAFTAAIEGARRGYPVGNLDIAGRIQAAVDLARSNPGAEAFADAIGTSVASAESVAAAFGVVLLGKGDPWQVAQIAANIGDDTDTIGAIATGMAAACTGCAALPADKIAVLHAANDLDIDGAVAGLLTVRYARMGTP
jgi:ADP-ribosylglycohydrolase